MEAEIPIDGRYGEIRNELNYFVIKNMKKI
jgi:hypothetical protein